MTRDRSGAALVLAVVLSLAGVLLGHATLAVARAEILSARMSAWVLQAEHAARGAAIEALERFPSEPVARSPFVSARDGGARVDSARGGSAAVRGVGRVIPISPEILWVEGVGRAGPALRQGGFPVWRLDPKRTADQLGGAIVSGAIVDDSGGAGVDASVYLDVPDPAPPMACPADSTRQFVPTPVPWRFASLDSAGALLGHFDLTALEERAELRVSRAGTPDAVTNGGRCVENPWNWGDPGVSSSPCAGRLPVVAVSEPVVIEGGRGQGVLVARGDLTLRDTEYFGLVIVAGVLRLEGRARLTGGAIAVGGARVGSDARVVASRCWLVSALGLPPLRVPLVIDPVRWIRLDE